MFKTTATNDPLVSVCMIAYNVGPYIAQSIEGVLAQQTGFAVELVIGEDCSKDDTRAICDDYAARYPDIIRVLPSDVNHGMAGNYARTVAACRGRYIAVCDSDDIWSDPLKLQQQVDFLEAHPDYGAVYTDVQTIDEHGVPFEDAVHEEIRSQYASGEVFFKLLQGNFLNHPTTVYRRSFLDDYRIDPDRHYYNYDQLLWLHIAAQSKIHFIDIKSTLYRKHSGSATRSTMSNRAKFQYQLYNILVDFDQNRKRTLTTGERLSVFQKMLSVLYRKENTFQMKKHILSLLPRYFPGVLPMMRLVLAKLGFPVFQSLNDNLLNSNLTESNL